MNFAREQMNQMLGQGGVPGPRPTGTAPPQAPIPMPAPVPVPQPNPIEGLLASILGITPMGPPSPPGVSVPLSGWPLNPGDMQAMEAQVAASKAPKPEKTFKKKAKPSSNPNRQAADKRKAEKK